MKLKISLLGKEGTVSGHQRLLAGSTCFTRSSIINCRADSPLDWRECQSRRAVALQAGAFTQGKNLGKACALGLVLQRGLRPTPVRASDR